MDRRILAILPAFVLSTFTAGLDQTAVATSLAKIAGDLGGLSQLSWIVTAYGIAVGVSTPVHGKLGDLYSRKRLFQLSLLIFMSGSALCGASQSMAELVAFRVLQGIGAGGIVINSQSILAELISPGERGRYIGFMQSAFIVSTVAGPTIGGTVTQELGWRWVFYLSVPTCLVALAVVTARLSLPRHDNPRKRIDWRGALAFTSAVSVIMLIDAWGGTRYAWLSYPIVGLAAAGVTLLLIFWFVERRAPDPLIPFRLFHNAVLRIVLPLVFIVGFSTAAVTVFIPVYLQVVLGHPPGQAGVLLAPLWLAWGVTATVCGQIMARTGRYRVFPVLGTLSLSAGLGMLALTGDALPYYFQATIVVVIGIGLGMVNSVLLIAAQNAVKFDEIGVATSTTTFSQTIGASFGAATLGAVFAKFFALSGAHPGERNLAGRRVDELPPGAPSELVGDFGRALHAVFAVGAGAAVSGCVLALLLREIPLRRRDDTSP